MRILEKQLGHQAQFLAFLGPGLILLSTLILLFKGGANLWYFPVAALIGIPLCFKWEMKGLALSLVVLFIFMGISYSSLPLEDRYWHVGMGMALALSFVVITLSVEESQVVIGSLQAESNSRLENIVKLNEQWQAMQQEWAAEKEALNQKVVVLTHELTVAQKDKIIMEKLASLAKEELLMVREQFEKIH